MGKGLFKGISEAVAGSNFVYITEGNYVLSLIRTKQVVKREGNDDLFISEWKVLDSDNPAHKVGSELSWTANLSRHEAALGNVKDMLAAASVGYYQEQTGDPDMDQDAVTAVLDEDDAERLVECDKDEDEDGGYRIAGACVYAQAKNIKTKKNKTNFTVVSWTYLAASPEGLPKD